MSRRHQIVGPLLLIAAGCLLLANRAGWLPDGFWDQLLGLWPVLLILAGLDLVFRRSDSGVAAFAAALVAAGVIATTLGAAWLAADRGGSGVATRESEYDIGPARSLRLSIDMDVGEVTVRQAPAGAEGVGVAVTDRRTDDLEVETSQSGSTAEMTIRVRDSDGVSFIGDSVDSKLHVTVPRHVALEIRVDAGVGRCELELQDLDVTRVEVSTGAGDTDVRLPSSEPIEMYLHGGVGSIGVTIPDGVDARVEADSGIGLIDVDDRFAGRGQGVFESRDYAPGGGVTLRADVGVGTITVR